MGKKASFEVQVSDCSPTFIMDVFRNGLLCYQTIRSYKGKLDKVVRHILLTELCLPTDNIQIHYKQYK